MQVHRRLAFSEEGIPGMYVFSTCKPFIRTLPNLVYSETDPEDIDTDLEDHDYDAMRYFFMMQPVPARQNFGSTKRMEFNPLNS